MQRRIGLVVFDLGRVMIRLCDGWRHACERAGAPIRSGLDDPQLRKQITELFILNETGRLDHDPWCEAVGRLTGHHPREVSAILDAWLDGPFPGWDALLDDLAEADVRTACLSNTNAVHWSAMLGERSDQPQHRLPLHRLHFRFASHLIQAHKPDPAIYRHVEHHTGVVPRAIVFFDDIQANVEAARSRGWAAQTIDTQRDPATQVREHLRGYGVLR